MAAIQAPLPRSSIQVSVLENHPGEREAEAVEAMAVIFCVPFEIGFSVVIGSM